eukprot:scaffold5560_cov444-Prasinococcus_capsulatus_cf.AAC.7
MALTCRASRTGTPLPQWGSQRSRRSAVGVCQRARPGSLTCELGKLRSLHRASTLVRCSSAPEPSEEPANAPKRDVESMRKSLESMVPSSAMTGEEQEAVVAEADAVDSAIAELGIEAEED